MVQWLRLHTSNVAGTGLILVGELRSHVLHGKAKKKKTLCRLVKTHMSENLAHRLADCDFD